MTLSISTDYTVFDNTETITYTRVLSGAMNDGGRKTETTVSYSIASVLRQMMVQHEQIERGAALLLADTKWEIPVILAVDGSGTAFVPKEGDRITSADGSIHFVMHFETVTVQTRYRVFTRKA